MGQYTATDPALVEEANVDGEGRIYVGRKFADRTFRVILEPTDEGENGS